MMFYLSKLLSGFKYLERRGISAVAYYVQGQIPRTGHREYFYYIDHQGLLFLDDSRMKNFTSCFKEKAFLSFFYKNLRMNRSDRYPEFPYLSLCGREKNFIRCDDLPVVFTNLSSNNFLCYGNADEILSVNFEPSQLFMQVETGRVYHPAMETVGGVGLIKSQLAIYFSSLFVFENGENCQPTHIVWKSEKIKLTQKLESVLKKLDDVRKYSLGIDCSW